MNGVCIYQRLSITNTSNTLAMVVVRDISANVFVRLGFKSKTQALDAYQGIRSKQGETEDQYLERTYSLVKHVIHQNQIDDLIASEARQRTKVVRSEVRSIRMRLKQYQTTTSDQSSQSSGSQSNPSQYDDLLDKYRELSSIVVQLKQENALLIKAYNNCAVRAIRA